VRLRLKASNFFCHGFPGFSRIKPNSPRRLSHGEKIQAGLFYRAAAHA
jgi:hypothetical protein